MKVLVDKLVIETDKTGQEMKLQPAAKLLASPHLMSLMAEYYIVCNSCGEKEHVY